MWALNKTMYSFKHDDDENHQERGWRDLGTEALNEKVKEKRFLMRRYLLDR